MRQWSAAAAAVGLAAVGLAAVCGAVAWGQEAASGSGSGASEASASAQAPASASASDDASTVTPPLASAENSARYRKCMGEAGPDRDKRRACRAERLQARAAREARTKGLRRGWALARKAVKPALALCRKLKDKDGAKAISAWLRAGDAWVKALSTWRKRGGPVSWQAPAAFEPCKAKESKKEAK